MKMFIGARHVPGTTLLTAICFASLTTLAFASSTPTPTPSPTQQSAPTATTATNQTAPTPSTQVTGPVSYADAVAQAAPAVVSIKTTKEIPVELNPMLQDPFFRYFFGDQLQNFGPGHNQGQGQGQNPHFGQQPNFQELPKEVQQGLGSGVIVNDKGYILTNNHVIKEVDTVIVTLADGRTSEAKVIGSDPDTDLAVLQIKLDKLPVIAMGSSQKLRAGDVVLAIGNPFGLDKTVTMGIVSAMDRTGIDLGILDNLIQTDAAINPGNSGGALIDALGRLVGINTVIYSRTGGYQGIGFAIPIDQATEVMKKLIEEGHVNRGYLGISLQPLNKEIRDYLEYKENDGAYIRSIVRGGPAQKAGLLPGDIVVKINNVAVKDERQAVRLVASLSPGKSYPVEVFRKGEHLTFSIVLAERKLDNKSRENGQNKTPGKEESSGKSKQ